MSSSRRLSSASEASSTISHASAESIDSIVTVMDLSFVDNIHKLMNDASYLDDALWKDAHLAIDTLLDLDGPSTTYHEIKLSEVLRAMLVFSQSIGSSSVRYTASAILACNPQTSGSEQLLKLGIAWLSHLLYPMKANGSVKTTLLESPEVATPTRDCTASLMDEGVNISRPDSFRKLVLERDGYKCIATGLWDLAHKPPLESTGCTTQAAHILKRAVAQFHSRAGNQAERDRYYNAVSTWDIIRNYGGLTDDDIADLAAVIDHPVNGLTLFVEYHNAWDNFYWSLRPVEGTGKYDIVFFDKERQPLAGIISPLNTVVLRNNSEGNISLPAARFIALHHALCGVLHMSGAGHILDLHFEKYRKLGGAVPVVDGHRLLDGPDCIAMMTMLHPATVAA